MSKHSKNLSSTILSQNSKSVFSLPSKGYGVSSFDSLVPGNLIAFTFFFVIYLFMTITLMVTTLLNSETQEDWKFYAIAAVAFAGAAFCGVKAFTYYHKWQDLRYGAKGEAEKARNSYITKVVLPWCASFNVVITEDEASRLLNGDIASATIDDVDVSVALIRNIGSYRLVEVSDVEEFKKEFAQLKTRHYDSGEVEVLTTEEKAFLRIRVDSFASYFNGDFVEDGFTDMSRAPGFAFKK